MRNVRKSLAGFTLAAVLAAGVSGGSSAFAGEAELTGVQQNAIAMLNYITVLTQDINASKNSRVYMEEAYSSLINNTYPNAVDSRTLNQMTGLLDTMESYRMINFKRERLQYVYEQSQAQAIRAVKEKTKNGMKEGFSLNPVELVSVVVHMAVDSYNSYTAYTTEAEEEYLKDGWALDADEAEALHESRKGTFSYMVKMVNDYSLPGDLILTEDTVSEFVAYKNSENLISRMQFLESNRDTYQSYGGYWLTLADCYYNTGDYQECIDAVMTYEQMDTRIFRRDYELAKVLPLAIAAAYEIYGIEEYASFASEQAQLIVSNTDHDDWALRYFAAQTFADLYTQTEEMPYLQEAYRITLDNVNYLVAEQKQLNAAYLSKVEEQSAAKGADKEEKKQIRNYNSMLREARKKELPPVYEPLLLNCDLLFDVTQELDVSQTEKNRIEQLLHPKGEKLFLTRILDERYWFDDARHVSVEDMDIDFGGDEIVLPAEYLTREAVITVIVIERGNPEPVIMQDWTLERVKRGKEGDLSTYEAVYSGEAARGYAWKPDSGIYIELCPRKDSGIARTFVYKAEGTKDDWYDYLMVWKGYKAHWYDYAKVWENSVRFVRMK